MDLDDFWQENKRWVLGCVAGLLVFLIANNIVADAGTRVSSGKLKGDYFTKKEAKVIAKDSSEFSGRLVALRKSMHFELPTAYVRKGNPDLWWTRTYDRVRSELRNLTLDANVDFPETSFAWTASDPAAQERALVGCAVVEHCVRQLIAAHRAVIDKDLDAIGLRSIGTFTLSREAGRRAFRRRQGDPIRPEELLSEVKISFKFQADHGTVHRFLENCRDGDLRIGLGSLKVVKAGEGEPLTVTGELIALAIKKIPEEGV